MTQSQLSNSNQIMKNCGAIAAEHVQFLDTFCATMGKSLFEAKQIPDRINFLFDTIEDTQVLMSAVFVGVHENTIWLRDEQGDFRNISVLIANEVDEGYFSIREFSKDPSEVCGDTLAIGQNDKIYNNVLADPSPHWNFTNSDDDEVCIYCPSDAFLDPYKTRAVTNLIVWASNILGYNSQESH